MADEKQDDGKQYTIDPDGTWQMDIDTFAPVPEGYITVGHTKYPIFNFLDVPVGDSLKVARLGVDIQASENYGQRMERSVEQILLLNMPGLPRLTAEILNGLRPRQIITLTVLASSIARVPQTGPKTADLAAESGAVASSPSPSPESAASTDGPKESYSA